MEKRPLPEFSFEKNTPNSLLVPSNVSTPGIFKGQALGSHVSKPFLQAASTLAAAALREKAAVGMEEVATTWNGMITDQTPRSYQTPPGS